MSLIFTPSGMVDTERPEVVWPPDFMRMLAIFTANCGDIELGIRCERCKQALSGQNAREDTDWRMECACRKYVGKNPLPKTMQRTN